MENEVRVVDPQTGGAKGKKGCELGAVDPLSLMELGRVAAAGSKKYGRYNYLKGYDWSLTVDAAFRHLLAMLAGEERDPETGCLHTAMFAWHGLCLTSFQLRKIGTDDRAPAVMHGETKVHGPSLAEARPFPRTGLIFTAEDMERVRREEELKAGLERMHQIAEDNF